MRRNEERRHLIRLAVLALGLSFAALWTIATIGWNMRPWDDYDKACMGKTVLELTQCINDVKRKKYGHEGQ